MRIAINPSAKSHPIWDSIVGAFFVGGQLVAVAYTAMTDESLFHINIPFSWGILEQPFSLLSGVYTGTTLWAVIYAWALISCYALLSLIDYFSHNKIIVTTIWLLIGLDSFANAQYFEQFNSIYITVISTLLIGLLLSYGGKIGTTLIGNALKNIRREGDEE